MLSKDDPSPFAPESDEEKPAEEKPAGEKPAGDAKPATRSRRRGDAPGEGRSRGERRPPKPGDAPPAKPVTVKIDVENILQRILAMPMPARRYVALQAGKAGVLLAVEAPDPFGGAAAARADRASLRPQGAQVRRGASAA